VTNPTGGYYFIGSNSLLPHTTMPQYSAVYYGKLNEYGDTVWTRSFVDSLHYAQGLQIRWSNDGQHLLLLANGNIEHESGLIKIDTNGNIIWYRMPHHVYNFAETWNTPKQVFNCLDVTPDERYLMAGAIFGGRIPGLYDTSGTLSWMVLTDSNGCRYPNDPACWPLSVKELPKEKEVGVYPNPFSEELTVGSEQFGVSSLQLIDMYGRVVYNGVATGNKTIINTGQLPTGNYILLLTDENGVKTAKKLVKAK
jgi:hypothetical protein